MTSRSGAATANARRESSQRSGRAISDASDNREWSIAEIADEFAVTHRTLRHYEELGLLAPERRGTARVFHRADRVRLSLVLRGKRLGFPLEEIHRIVTMYDDHPGEAGQLRYLLGQVDDRRAELLQRRADIDQLLAELEELERRCREELAAMPSVPVGAG